MKTALLQNIKKELIERKTRAVVTRVRLGDLTTDEAGHELALYMSRVDSFSNLDDLDRWLNGKKETG